MGELVRLFLLPRTEIPLWGFAMNDAKPKPDSLVSEIRKLSAEDALNRMQTTEAGLSAQQVAALQAQHGKNVIRESKRKPYIVQFLENFISMMAILLWISGVIAFVAGMPTLGVAIWLVNIINGTFSFWQEFRAGKATEALQKMLPAHARVIRDGKEEQILAEDLVPGDIVQLEEGDNISADARLLTSDDMQVNQSALTGESNPDRKHAAPDMRDSISDAESSNIVFAGTTVASGGGKAVVLSIGMDTAFGRIATLTQSVAEEKSPLQKELDKLTKQIAVIAVLIGVAFFLAAVFFVHNDAAQSFIFALGMIVAFIPEGLLPTVTLSLAMAVQRMAAKNALVKKLSAVETLGSTSVICSDKTGTLTQNAMTVTRLWLPALPDLTVTGQGYSPDGEVRSGSTAMTAQENNDLSTMLTAAALCNNADVNPPDSEHLGYTVLGDPTEACLKVVAAKAGIDPAQAEKDAPRLRELPFDSQRKRMTTIHPLDGKKQIAYVKGAPGEVLQQCTRMQKNGTAEALSENRKKDIMQVNDTYARSGLRVLAVACRVLTPGEGVPDKVDDYTIELIEHDLVFVGLIAMIDPPRPEVADAIARCHSASIRIIMVTGDYSLTAESIARHVGIVQGENVRVISGVELDKMSDAELQQALAQEVIFARVAPENKFRIVSNLQQMDHIVAVTGDGVNDAPALKKADIGVAMGITGTDVAKAAADMILTDDNFASIVNAVEEGRAVYGNIQKFLLYILNSNMPEAVPSAAFLFSRGGIPLPLTVMQILSVDLGTDMVPAIGIGTEQPEEGIMEHPPRERKASILNKKLIIKAFCWYGMLASVVSLGAYFFVQAQHGWPDVPLAGSGDVYRQATTMTLAAIIFCQIGAVLNCRTETESVFKIGIFGNKRILLGIVVEICLLLCLSYIPLLQDVFGTAPLARNDWLFLIVVPFFILGVEELRKALVRRRQRKMARNTVV